LRLLQRVRDEAHRFANAYHQKLRERRVVFPCSRTLRDGDKRKRDYPALFGRVGTCARPRGQIAEVVGRNGGKARDYLREHPDVV